MTNNNIIDFFLISFVIYWIVSVIYIINWHRKQGNLSYGTVFVALLIGGVIILILWDEEKEERKRKREERQRETGDRHRRWFQTLGLINRNAIPDYGRTIPPPPPISRVDRARSERDEAIRMARERINKNKITDFKFLKG
jgi:uncharacterized membrane protein